MSDVYLRERVERESTLTTLSGFGTPLAKQPHDDQYVKRNAIWRIASDNIALDRERVSANIEIALTQVLFGN